MIDITNTKKEIITEILALAKYLKKNKLFDMTRSASSLDQDNKQELIELHRRMVAVISGDIIKHGKDGEVPELKELADEYHTKHKELYDSFLTNRDNYFESIENLVHDWLGEDLIVHVSDTNIELRMSKDSRITISIYYRERWENKNPSKGHLELNHPSWGAWDPKNPENSDAVRFFQVMNNIISDANDSSQPRYDKICDLMDKNYQNTIQLYRDNDKLDDEYHDKAAVIAGEMVMKNYDEYIK